MSVCMLGWWLVGLCRFWLICVVACCKIGLYGTLRNFTEKSSFLRSKFNFIFQLYLPHIECRYWGQQVSRRTVVAGEFRIGNSFQISHQFHLDWWISVCMARLHNGFGLLAWLVVGWFVWFLVNLCGCLVGVLGWLVCLLGWSVWLVLNWFSDARKRHFKTVISQNFPCGVGRGRPPPPPSPSPALSLRRHRSSFF